MGHVSGVSGIHKFHCRIIPEGFLKIDIDEILDGSAPLMVPNEEADQVLLADARGSSVMWGVKHVKHFVGF